MPPKKRSQKKVENEDSNQEEVKMSKRKAVKNEKKTEDVETKEEKTKSGRKRAAKPEEPVETENSDGDGSKRRRNAKTEDDIDTKKSKNEASETDYSCSKENLKGELANFKITSWNVAGLKAWLGKKGLDYIEEENPDVFCLQETKCNEKDLPEEVKNLEGYPFKYFADSEKKGYAGVAIFSKTEPVSIKVGFDTDEDTEKEGRCVTLEFEKFYLIGVYVPNAGRKLVTLDKRLKWNEDFKKYVVDLDKKKPVILCGDMNVAHEEIDLKNPKTNKKNAGFTQEERDGMTDFLKEGFVDTFRKMYPDDVKYTFWTYMGNARAKDVGWRLDYFIVSDRIYENVCDNAMRTKVMGSDHCPITLQLNI